ncbi:MAG: GT4 family glycosyltransferase PelF, partial [Chloroflexota bacterium]
PINIHLPARTSRMSRKASQALVDTLANTRGGLPVDMESLARLSTKYHVGRGWLASKSYWDSTVSCYLGKYQESPFLDYFWTGYGYYSILLGTMSFIKEIPRADVYHALSCGMAGFIGSLAKALYGKPLILTEQGLYLVERRNELSRTDMPEASKQQIISFSESLVKTTYKYADRIVPPCYSHVKIEVGLGADPKKIQVVNNGIEVDRFTPGPERNGHKPVVGCLARVVPIKGITYFIKAAKAVHEKQEADFVVVGGLQDKAYHKECLNLISELGIGDYFKFIGHSNALEWYQRLDIFVLPSLSEGVPYALLEAMSCALPCVCSAVGGIPEILPDTSVGFVVPPGESGHLAEKISVLLSDREMRKRIGQQAYRRARKEYTLEHEADEYRKIYERVSDECTVN